MTGIRIRPMEPWLEGLTMMEAEWDFAWEATPEAAVGRVIPAANLKRRQEFIAGRLCVMEAMARTGGPATWVERASDGRPLFPEGFVGSISHCENRAVAAVGPARMWKSLGIDVQSDFTTEVFRSVEHQVLTERESRWVRECGQSPEKRAALLFSAKEAVFKTIFPLEREFFGFHDVELESASGDLSRLVFRRLRAAAAWRFLSVRALARPGAWLTLAVLGEGQAP